jgi:hypothetical protein
MNIQVSKAMNFFAYLIGRWQDEQEYEDFERYKTAMRKNLPRGTKFVRMTQRPFAVEFKLGPKQYQIKRERNNVATRSWAL